MKDKFLVLLLFSGIFFSLSAQPPLAIGEWRTHLPWKNIEWITDAGDRIYCAGNASFYSYDKENGYLQKFDKVSGLSDIGVKLVEYFNEKDILLVVYDNTNIDVIKGNTIVNISDIKRKSIIGEKIINHVYFFNNLAYLSCSFGILVLDLEKMEVKDTYVIGSNGDGKVYALTSDGVYFYAATGGGIKKASVNSLNLANFQEWTTQIEVPAKPAHQVVTFNGKIYVEVTDTVYEFDGNSWSYFYTDTAWFIQNITASEDYLLVSERNNSNIYDGRIAVTDKSDNTIHYTDNIGTPMRVIEDEQGVFWIADFLSGLKKMENGQISGPYAPNGPGSAASRNISIERGEVWVAPGGVNSGWGFSYNGDGYFQFVNNEWRHYNKYNVQLLMDSDVISFHPVVVHPVENKVYLGSWYEGLLENDNGNISLYNQNNSILEGIVGAEEHTVISGLALDNNDNLWMTSFGAPEKPIIVKKKDGTWKSFKPTVDVDPNLLEQMIIDESGQIWMVIVKNSSKGILVFDYGEDIDNTSDDQYRIISSGEGNGNLPTSEVICLAEDLNGEIWVGTAQGVAVFYCASSVFSGCEAQRILVTQDGFAGYLLENERVTSIAIDGGNRKWVGTTNGVFVLSPDGTQQIAYFTEQNSPLLSNSITDIAIDGETGEAFIGTEQGIISYRGEATVGGESHEEVLVFPNPVRKDYDGPIAIKGLVNDADVKITDVTGILIYQTKALGGQAIWNGRNYNGTRAKTGVYLVFSSNEDGSSKNVAKLLIVN